MTIRANFKKSRYVLSSVRNPLRTIRSLSKFSEDGFSELDICFKDGSHFESLPIGAAWMMISYYYWSHRKECYSRDDLSALHSVGVEIYSKLEEKCRKWVPDLWNLQGTHGITFMLVRKFKPHLIVETGIAHGYSARIILEALRLNSGGKLISVEIADEVDVCGSKLAPGWLVPYELRDNWKVITGDSIKMLGEINETPDIFIHDSWHAEAHMLNEYRWASRHLKPSGILISDDIDRNMAWRKFHKEQPDFRTYIESATTGVSLKRN